jgi:hypothetical protein
MAGHPKGKKKRLVWKTGQGITVIRKAKTFHECSKCHGEILPGETYYELRRFWSWKRYKVCRMCWKL